MPSEHLTRREALKTGSAAAVAVLGLGRATPVSAFDGGDGSEDDPYQIATLEHLQAIREEPDAHYALVESIDGSNADELNNGDGFEPIEGDFFGFGGSLDGQGNTIENLSIDSDGDEAGIFASTDGAVIEDVDVEGIDVVGESSGFTVGTGGLVGDHDGELRDCSVSGTVTGGDNVGGLVGRFSDGEITDSAATAAVEGDESVGGLVGANPDGIIDASTAEGDVIGEDQPGGLEEAGGLVGSNDGTVAQSAAQGDVQGYAKVGGLVGQNRGLVTESFADGPVSGREEIGGLIGTQRGEVNDSRARGSVDGTDQVGGLVGNVFSEDIIRRCYAVGTVSGDTDTGGLVGREVLDAIVESGYWDTEATGQEESARGVGLTTAEMQGEAAATNLEGFDFEDTWRTVASPDGYPELQWQSEDESEENWWDPYTNDDEIASSAGQHVVPAIQDFEATGEPGAGQVITLIQSFETGAPVPELL